jgi:orotate phosphoribosyltransferase-like protein
MEARPHKVYEALKAEVLKLHEDGMKPKQIQDKLKVSKDFVRGVLKHEKS